MLLLKGFDANMVVVQTVQYRGVLQKWHGNHFLGFSHHRKVFYESYGFCVSRGSVEKPANRNCPSAEIWEILCEKLWWKCNFSLSPQQLASTEQPWPDTAAEAGVPAVPDRPRGPRRPAEDLQLRAALGECLKCHLLAGPSPPPSPPDCEWSLQENANRVSSGRSSVLTVTNTTSATRPEQAWWRWCSRRSHIFTHRVTINLHGPSELLC